MKNTILVALLTASSFSVVAAPYVGFEYGYATANHDFSANYTADNITLEPSSSDGVYGGFIGYQMNPTWAVEFGYSQYDLEDDRSRHEGILNNIEKETKWDSKLTAHQFAIAPVYTYSFNPKITAKLKAGLTYTQYKASSSKYIEEENIITDVEIITPVADAANQSIETNEIGAFASFGAEYRMLSQLALSANAKFQFDGYANVIIFNIGATYYF